MNKKLTTGFFIIIILFSFKSVFGVERISTHADKREVIKGEKINFRIDIHFEGPQEKLITYPPKLESLDGVEVISASSSSTSSNEQVIQSYFYELRLNRIGDVKIDPVIIAYIDKQDGSEKEMQASGITFTVKERSLLRNPRIIVSAVGFLLMTVFIAAITIINKRSVSENNGEGEKPDGQDSRELLLGMKKSMVEGNYTDFLDHVVKISDITGSAPEEHRKYSEMLEKARFASFRFKKEEIEAIYNLMENRLKKEDKSTDELNDIKFEN